MPRCPVLLLSRALDSGGTERQLTEMAKALDRSEWEPHVACFHDTGIRAQELRKAGIPVVRLPVRSFLSSSAMTGLMRLRRYMREHAIVISHSFDAPMNIFAVPAARAFGCPIVLSSQRSHRCLRTPAERRLLRFTDRLVDGIVVNCESVKRHLVEDESVDRGKIHVCYNGIDTQVFRPDPGFIRPQPLAAASLVIGTVCVLRPEKSIETLLHAFASIRHLKPGMKLLIVGSGSAAKTLQQTAASLGLGESCVFQPATRDVVSWLHAIDIFVLPSLSEALSNALMEAMACRCCPLASDQGGNPELVRHGHTGLLFRPGDAADLAEQLKVLLASPSLMDQLAASAMEYIHSSFSLHASADRLQTIYDELLSRAE